VSLERGRVVARVERVYARRVLATREESPTGELARAALGELFVRGSIFREALPPARERLAAWALASRLRATGYAFDDLAWQALDPALTDLGPWVATRLEALGVESGDDLALLSPKDLVPPALPDAAREQLDRDFPRVVQVGDASYEVDYDLAARQATLRMVRGTRRDPPPLAYLPKLPGFKICVEAGRSMWIVRDRP
jgi:ATP-dependent helicase HrpB